MRRAIVVSSFALLACSKSPSSSDVKSPTPPANPNAIVGLVTGHGRACAVRVDGHVVCWGTRVFFDQPEVDPAPHVVPGLDDATGAISGEDGFWCAIRKGGALACWEDGKAPTDVFQNVVAVSRSCVLLADHTEHCGMEPGKSTRIDLADVSAIAVGEGPYCAVAGADRKVFCWGDNYAGQLGDGTKTNRDAPLEVKGIAGVDQLSIGRDLVCARAGTKVSCWGGELYGWGAPHAMPELGAVAQITVGEYTTCARRTDGTIMCFGGNSNGQLGAPNNPEGNDTPALVPGFHDVVDVEVGGGEPCGGCGSTCTIDKAGTVACIGALGGGNEKITRIDLTVK